MELVAEEGGIRGKETDYPGGFLLMAIDRREPCLTSVPCGKADEQLYSTPAPASGLSNGRHCSSHASRREWDCWEGEGWQEADKVATLN